MTIPTSPKPELGGELITKRGPVLILALLSVIAGAAVGLLGAVFRLALGRADRLRNSMIVWLHVEGIAGFLAVIGISALATACAAWLVRRFPRRPLAAAFRTSRLSYMGDGQAIPCASSPSSSSAGFSPLAPDWR